MDFRSPERPWKNRLTLVLSFVVLSSLIWVGCVENPGNITDSVQDSQQAVLADQEISALNKANPEIQSVMAVQNRNTNEIMSQSGVVGTATGLTTNGKPAILVLVKDNQTALNVKNSIENVPVRVLITGEIKALKGKPGGGGGDFNPRTKHRPAPNGVSLGHPDITAGTLGCLVEKGGTTYILSNNHVMANENNASIGNNILQPGPFDGGQSPGDRIATLSDYEPIVFSTSANNIIDAAIAKVDNVTDVTGETVSYGPPRSTTVTASVRMSVIKYGRTTDDTKGRVQGINATVNVGYDGGTARFVNQIVIGGGGFSSGGDSGSLIVASKGSNDRKPVGLLFAGGGGTTIANPIDDVLARFNVTIVGN